MKRCEVLIPFHLKATETDHVPGDVIEVSEEQLAKIRKLSVNMVRVVEDVVDQVEPEKPKKKRTKKQ